MSTNNTTLPNQQQPEERKHHEFSFNSSNVPKPLQLSLRSKLKNYMKHNGYFLDMEILQVIISFLFFVIFVADVYTNFVFYSQIYPQSNPNPNNSFSLSDQHIQFMLQGIFVCDLILCTITVSLWFVTFLLTKHKLRYLIHPHSILDFITVVPMIPLCIYILFCINHYGLHNDRILVVNRDQTNTLYVNLFNISVMISIFRLIRLVRIVFVLTWKKNILHYVLQNSFGFGPTLQVQIACLVALVVTLMVLFAGTFQMIEFLFGGHVLSLHDSIYFMVITMATIGYGDISPTTVASKYWTIGCFLIGITFIPYQLSLLLSTSEKAIFRARHANLKNHVIICGYFQKQHVLDFLKEFYHSMHGKNSKKTLIVSRNKKLCESISEIIKARQYLQEKVLVFHGDLMDYETSKIIRIHEAHSVFLLNSMKHSNPRHNDTSIMVATIGLKNINPDLDIYAQVTLPESRAYLYKAGAKQVICTETISSKIMGMSVVYHGFSTLIVNLVTTIYVRNAIENHKYVMEQEKKKPWLPFFNKKADSVSSEESLWIYEYLDGLGNEIYCVKFSPFFEGMTFIKAVAFIRENLDLTLIALEYLDTHDESLKSVSLNPFDELIHVEKCKAFVIAQSIFHANLVYLFENAKAKDESDKESTSSADTQDAPVELNNVQNNKITEMESFETFFVSEENAYEKTINNEELSMPNIETRPKVVPTRRKLIKGRNLMRRPPKKSTQSLGPSHSNISFSSNIETPPEAESPSILTNSSTENPNSYVSTSMSGLDKQILDFDNIPHISETEMNKGFLLRLFRSVAPPTFFYQKSDNCNGVSFKHFLNEFYKNVLDNYNLLTKSRPKDDFYLSSTSFLDIKNHIILVGELKYPLVILATIRSIRKRHFTPIVIMVSHAKLHGNPYVDYLYDRLKFFDQVFFLKGNATDVFDLHRCGVLNAEAVVYLSRQYGSHGHNTKLENDYEPNEASDDLIDTSEYLRDAEVIKLIESISFVENKKFFIMELNNLKNIKFLKQGGCFSKKHGENHSLFKIFRSVSSMSVAFDDPLHCTSDRSDEYDQFCLLSELYSSGRIFPISFIPKLLAQSFYTEKLNEIIEHMSLDGLCSLSKSSIFQEDCPSNCFGKSVIDIFLELCEVSNLILIGLYRPKRIFVNGVLESIDNDFYYVYTHPRQSIILLEGDKLFLCGRRSKFADFTNKAFRKSRVSMSTTTKEQDHVSVNIPTTTSAHRDSSPRNSVHDLLSRQSFDHFMSKHKSKM